MKLNLGCGDRYVEGWVNVDHRSPHKKDLVVDLTDRLPWTPPWDDDQDIAAIYAGHLLEHLTTAQCRFLLSELLLCVRPGVPIMIVGPDVDRARAMIDAGTFDPTYHSLHSIRFGGSRWPGDQHQWDCTGPRVAKLLRNAGWLDVHDVGIENVSEFWPVADRAPRWQCAISAVSP